MAGNINSFKEYLGKEKKYSFHTVNAYVKDVEDFELFILNNYGQDDLTVVVYNQIRSWIVFLVEGGLSNVSVNRKIASLKAFYKFLLKSKQINVNPLQQHKALKVSRKLQIPFSAREVNLVLVGEGLGANEFESLRDKLVVELFYSTGIRRAELINVKIENIDFYGNTIKVLGKRNKERVLPLLSFLKDQISLYLDLRAGLKHIVDSDFLLLTKKGVKLNESFVYRLINSYFSRVSEKTKKSPHVLRHTFATHLLNNGADLNSVKELLGHASLASTQVYTHSSLSELNQVYKKAHPRNNK